MGKPYIVIGDKTSHGGVVIAGSPTSSINGKAIARVGDRATCPIKGHGEITTILSGDPDATFDGKAPARQGDKTACGATLIASQSQTMDEEGGGGGVAPGAAPSAVVAAASRKNAFDAQIQFTNANGALPHTRLTGAPQ